MSNSVSKVVLTSSRSVSFGFQNERLDMTVELIIDEPSEAKSKVDVTILYIEKTLDLEESRMVERCKKLAVQAQEFKNEYGVR